MLGKEHQKDCPNIDPEAQTKLLRARRVLQLPCKGYHSKRIEPMGDQDPSMTLLQILDSFKATLDRAIGSLDRAGRAMEAGELTPQQILKGLKSNQTDLVDLGRALSILTANDAITD